MSYRIYLRWPGQRVSDKTVTASPAVAEQAFRELLGRRDLLGQDVAAVLSLDNRQLEYVRFDKDLKGPDDPIKLSHES